MSVGDIVRMKYMMFWVAKSNAYVTYTKRPGIVLEIDDSRHRNLKIYQGGKILRVSQEEWERCDSN